MYSPVCTYALPHVGSPIRKSAGHWICAPYRSLSQLITSFFGSQCQGIPLMLLLLDQITSHNSILLRLCSFARQLHTQVCAFLAHSRSSYNTNSARNYSPVLAFNTGLHSLLFSRCEFVSGFSQQIVTMNRYPSLSSSEDA